MEKSRIDIREELLKIAGTAFLNRKVSYGNYEYVGEDAVKVGMALIDIVEYFDREFIYNKK